MPRASLLLKHSDIRRTNIYGYGFSQLVERLLVKLRDSGVAHRSLALYPESIY